MATAAGFNTLFMWRLNELWSLDRVIETQAAGLQILYNGLTLDDYEVKLKALALTKPEVVAVGSSRSFPVRDYMFNVSFYNLSGRFGRALNFPLANLDAKKAELLGQPSIRYVFLFLDYYWFMGDVPNGTKATAVAGRNTTINRRRLVADDTGLGRWLRAVVLPRALMRDGILSWTQYRDVILGRYPVRVGELMKVGFTAVLNGSGMAQDGSYYYLWLKAVDDRADANCSYLGDFEAKKRLPHGAYRPNQVFDWNKLAAFKAFIQSLENGGIRVIPVLPPLPPSMLNRMSGDPDYAFVEKWRRIMADEIMGVRDFHDIRPLGATECEFMDDVHGQDVAYLRMFREMARQDKEVARLLNLSLIDQLIDEFAGRRLITSHGLGKAAR